MITHHAFDTFWRGHHIDRVYFIPGMTADEIRRTLIEHDGYPADIEVKPRQSTKALEETT